MSEQTPDELAKTSLESEPLSETRATNSPSSGWLRMGLIAATSAVAGGVAAAWWYRNTLKKLRQADEKPNHPQDGIPSDDLGDES